MCLQVAHRVIWFTYQQEPGTELEEPEMDQYDSFFLHVGTDGCGNLLAGFEGEDPRFSIPLEYQGESISPETTRAMLKKALGKLVDQLDFEDC